MSKVPGKDEVQIMDLENYETFTATVDPAMFQKINEGSILTFINVLGKVIVLETREAKE